MCIYTVEDNQSFSRFCLSFLPVSTFFITYLRHEFSDTQHSVIDVNVSSMCRWRCNHCYTLMHKYDEGINIDVPSLWSLRAQIT